MSDQFDHATDQEIQANAAALKAQQLRAASAVKLTPTGECLNPLCCLQFNDEPLRLFCGPSCARQFDVYKK